jgi:hypothetical protein
MLSIFMVAAAPGSHCPSAQSAKGLKTSNVKTRAKKYNIFVVSQTHRATLSLRQKITERSPAMEKTSDKFWRIPNALPVLNPESPELVEDTHCPKISSLNNPTFTT